MHVTDPYFDNKLMPMILTNEEFDIFELNL